MMNLVTPSAGPEKGRLHFKNPPIVEAVIAINVMPLPAAILRGFREVEPTLLSMGYRRREIPVTLHAFQMKIEDGKSQVSGSDSVHGVRFDSTDSRYAVQFNLTGFVFSRLGEYHSWEQFTAEAMKLWAVFMKTVADFQIVSFGVRFINKLFIPLREDLSKFLRIYPQVPDDVPEFIHEMFMRLALAITQPPGVLVHHQTLLPPEREGFATNLLDNDFQFPALNESPERIWILINEIRDLKDDYFVKFLTPAMMETFNV